MKLLYEGRGFSMPEDARDLIEGVYGADADIPDGLQEKSMDAYADDRVKASFADLNALDLSSGYTTQGEPNWWDDTKTPTRLGEETTTVWLARWEDGELRPLHDLPSFAWQQSSVAIRSALITETLPDDEISEEIIQACTEQLPAKGKWGILLPLARNPSGVYQAEVKDQNGIPAKFHYHHALGLMTAKEYNQLEGKSA
jgi:CRISPR-associated endonuclease/helicase Cas3